MKKNIGDFCRSCIIDIPKEINHTENLLIRMIDNIKLPSKENHIMIRKYFWWLGAVCIKKDTNNIIGQEYYFTPKAIDFSKVASLLKYKFPPNIHAYDFLEYSFDFHDGEWECNMFDNVTAAYFIGKDSVKMKNVYYGFQHHQKANAYQCMSKSIYPFTQTELQEILFWTNFQREDGNILIGRKAGGESVYFSRINFLGFLKFVKKFWWKKYIWEYLKNNRSLLKYYLFDINIQYSYVDGKMKILKTSIYGLI